VANLESLTKGFQSWIKVADHSNTKWDHFWANLDLKQGYSGA
jgi:hypothetical protein